MPTTNVPTCLLRQVCYPTSYRLPKLERLIYPPPKQPSPKPEYSWNAGSSSPFTQSRSVPPNRMFPLPSTSRPEVTERQGNLTNDEYRYYEGVDSDQGSYARCRYCQSYCGTKDLRTKHLNAGPCKSLMNAIYRELREKHTCLVCHQQTARMKWGIRLCSNRCINVFKFRMPIELTDAVRKCIQTYGRG